MAIRVQTQNDVTFGPINADITVTHLRITADGDSTVKSITNIDVADGDDVVFDSGEIDLLAPSGDWGNDLMNNAINGYWDGKSATIDLMTSATQVVTASGYTAQTYDNWAISSEAD